MSDVNLFGKHNGFSSVFLFKQRLLRGTSTCNVFVTFALPRQAARSSLFFDGRANHRESVRTCHEGGHRRLEDANARTADHDRPRTGKSDTELLQLRNKRRLSTKAPKGKDLAAVSFFRERKSQPHVAPKLIQRQMSVQHQLPA